MISAYQSSQPLCWTRRALTVWAAALAVLCPMAVARAQDEAPPAIEVPAGAVGGMGDINLYPRRVVMDGRQRIASVGLYNRTANEGDYEIAISNMVMGPSGQIFSVDSLPEGVSADGLKAADQMLRWSPRRVTLLGNEAQTVRIMARPAADLPPGEYRSHFNVISIPRGVDEGVTIDSAVNGGSGDASQIGVVIRPRFGIAIPVIVRIGETTLQVGLADVALARTEQGTLSGLTITRAGTRSAYGDIVVTMRGQPRPVAMARGIGVYPEVSSRPYQLAFDSAFDPSLLVPGTVLSIAFVDDDVAPGATLASIDYTVP